MEESRTEPRAKRAWASVAAWMGGITAVLGFIGAVTGAFSNFGHYLNRGAEIKSHMELAESQISQGEYAQANQTYTALLQAHPKYQPALDARLRATEQWVENFHVTGQDAKSIAETAGPMLDQIFIIFDDALARAKGTKRADVQAHLGWTHWLNRRIALREFGAVAEQDFRAALVTDPENVYANAMLGNWILQNHGDLLEAVRHFDTAVASGKERGLVRRFQLAALTFLEVPGARKALYQALNDMRRNGESLPPGSAANLRRFCCTPGAATDEELRESLSAVPREEAWRTYTWLDAQMEDAKQKQLQREFIQARLAEIAGDRDSALAQFRRLQAELKEGGNAMDRDVARCIARLRAPSKRN